MIALSEKIPTVIVEFKHLPDFVISEEEYNKNGKWNGFLRNNHINPRDVKRVHRKLMAIKDYPTGAWEG